MAQDVLIDEMGLTRTYDVLSQVVSPFLNMRADFHIMTTMSYSQEVQKGLLFAHKHLSYLYKAIDFRHV